MKFYSNQKLYSDLFFILTILDQESLDDEAKLNLIYSSDFCRFAGKVECQFILQTQSILNQLELIDPEKIEKRQKTKLKNKIEKLKNLAQAEIEKERQPDLLSVA